MIQSIKVKFSVMVLAYNQEEFIDYYLRAIYPYIYKIVIMYADKPFDAYNPTSRDLFNKVDKTLEMIEAFPDTENKLIIKMGCWSDEEAMRNEALAIMRECGSDYCLIIDADEFFPDQMLPKILAYLSEKVPYNMVAWAKYRTPYKRLDYEIQTTRARLPVAVKINDDTKFIDKRIPTGEQYKLPDQYFYWHLGYVLSNRRMYEKINTYSHAHELPQNWYEEKWLNWTPETTNLCRKDPTRWPRTVKFNSWDLPSIIYTHPFFPYGPKE
jgi:hypothetical protein